ncbi:unnamed protein product [Gadus morhua 'NCC']
MLQPVPVKAAVQNSQVEEFMRDTALYRARWVRENSGKSVHDVLQEFPQLTNPGMIAKDFQAIHPDSAMQTWTPELEEKVLNLAPIKRKLQVSTDGLGQETKTFLALKILPALVPNSVYRVGR